MQRGPLGLPTCDAWHPYGTYTIKGRITNVEGNPLNAFIVSRSKLRAGYKPGPYDLFTDTQANYLVSGENRHGINSLLFTDPDSCQNDGRFVKKGIAVDLSNAEQIRPGEGWFKGDYLKIVDVVLEKEVQFSAICSLNE